MQKTNFRARSAHVHQFAMVPRADVPRASFKIEHTHKTTFDAGYLVPIYVDEVLPGDTFNMTMTGYCRMSTPVYPVMDNIYLDTFFFFVPARLVWANFRRFMGEQPTGPTDSTSFVIPQVISPTDGWAPLSLGDYFGLPTVGQVGNGNLVSTNALPLRAYNLIYNEWFRDQNLQNAVPAVTNDGPDPHNIYNLLRRGKRHDYFTSALPFLQKGASVTLPLGSTAPVITNTTEHSTGAGDALKMRRTTGATFTGDLGVGSAPNLGFFSGSFGTTGSVYPTNLYADLSAATAATINQIRQAFQIQKLLERDARGGTRYTEIVRAHFGVISPDARLQRPEYLGGGSNPINMSAIPQTSATGLTGGTAPMGTLAAVAEGVLHASWSQAFTEHGYVIGLVSARADLTYQQGIRRMWSRNTRYDFYFPAFAHLGEQAVLNKEIYTIGTAQDENVFGYQERWAEYRYHPSRVSALFRSTTTGTLDGWHLAQRFTSLPILGTTFIQENPPISRVLAVGQDANGQQFILDALFSATAGRPLPMFSVPGLVDHF